MLVVVAVPVRKPMLTLVASSTLASELSPAPNLNSLIKSPVRAWLPTLSEVTKMSAS